MRLPCYKQLLDKRTGALLALPPLGIIWILSIGGIIDRNLALVLAVLVSIAGLGITILSWFFPNPFVKSHVPISLPKIPHKEDGGYIPFNEVLERELRKRKWKEEDLAKRIGVSPQDVYKWEKGELEPTSDAHCEILCEIFEMTPEEMGLTRDETMGGILRSAFMVDVDRFEDEHDY